MPIISSRHFKARVFAPIAAALLSFAIVDHSVFAQSANELATAAKQYPGIDPKNTFYVAPEVHEADYQSYYKVGNSELVIKPVFNLADGTKTLCQLHPHETAYLYPRTDYTVWLVENWIFQLMKSGRNSILTSSPGQYFHQYLPAYLNINHRVNVIRATDCNANHEYVFENLPVGKYVLYIYHVNWVSDFRRNYNTQTIMTPDGPHNEVVPGGTEDSSHVTDSYIDYTQDAISINAPYTRSTLDPSILKTVVHFQEGHD
jgi:hypothetical protein